MATNNLLQRGFKAKAERLALSLRKELNLEPSAPLCAFALSKHISISIYEATIFLHSPIEVERLSSIGNKDCGWSALTMKTQADNTIIIHNPFHSLARQQSNLMHELAHILCGHKIEKLNNKDLPLPIGMRHFNEIHEEEAKCLGATLQIPRIGLLWGLDKGMNYEAIASYYNASIEMVMYRMRITGVIKQANYKKKLI